MHVVGVEKSSLHRMAAWSDIKSPTLTLCTKSESQGDIKTSRVWKNHKIITKICQLITGDVNEINKGLNK